MRKRNGFTLIEILIVITIFALIVPILGMVINSFTGSLTGFEADQSIKRANQLLIDDIFANISQSKRLFQNTSNDVNYASRLTMSGCPAVLVNSHLPLIISTGTLSPNNPDFTASSAGNCLFFSSGKATRVLTDILNASSVSHTVRIDRYVFYVYYLSDQYQKKFKTGPSYNVYRWVSVSYADYAQLMSITDTTMRKNTVKALYALGLHYAWDASQTSVSSAFYSLANDGTINSVSDHMIIRDAAESKFMLNILADGYGYGIAPNSTLWSRSPRKVPQYATANSNFPGGFEIMIIGPAGGRKVLIHTVVAAEGALAQKAVAHELTIVASTKDLW
jgi:prepilin-type N-terminal cleavage/methylation domain-containing protein